MIINEIINEPYIFHFTGMRVLFKIIISNKLEGNSTAINDYKFGNKAPNTISFTRNSSPSLKLPYGRSKSVVCLVFIKSTLSTEPYFGDVNYGKFDPHEREMEEREMEERLQIITISSISKLLKERRTSRRFQRMVTNKSNL